MPLFFAPGLDTAGQSFPVFALQVIAISVAMAWIYARSGSLMVVMLMHAAINNTKDIVPSVLPGAHAVFGWKASPVSWATLVLLWLVAAACLSTMPKRAPLDPPR